MKNIFYDVTKEDDNYRIDLFRENVVNEKVNKKVESSLVYELIGSQYSTDLVTSIQNLKAKGYRNGSRAVLEDYPGVIINNALTKLKLMYLRRKIKVLEKVYTDEVIDGMCYINTYLVYIDLDTGLIQTLYLGNLGIHNDKVVNYLFDNNYVYVKDSLLKDEIANLHSKKLVLNKKPR